MERIKYDAAAPTDQELIQKRRAERHRLLEDEKAARKRKHKAEVAEAAVNGLSDEIWRLCYLYRVRDLMEARFGHRDWMDNLPPLRVSGITKCEDGLYRPCDDIRVTC
jgi:hypothetical protein